jgi:hypothetical protein
MAPLVYAVPIDGPAHLFRTRGMDGALGFVEFDAARLEF